MKGFSHMKKTALFTALLCAAALTACGNTAANDSTLKIEVQTSTTASSAVTASADTTTTTASAVAAASAQNSTAASETTTAAKSESTAASSVQTTVSETESTQPAETETAPQSTDAPAETTTVKETTAPPETTTAAKQLRLFADLNVGDDATAYIQQNPCVPDEATSCHGEGKDRVYQYSSYTLNTFFNGKTDKVFEIVVTAPGIKVEDVLEIGMKKADVIAKIGEGEDDIYHRDKYDLNILYDDDETVSEISLIDPEA